MLLSVRPRWAHALITGDKRAEFRTRYPLDAPRTVVVYATAPVKLVIGVLTVSHVDVGHADDLWVKHHSHAGLSKDEYDRYFHGRASRACAIVVDRAQQLRAPVPLSLLGVSRPPQSWRYLPSSALSRCR